MRLWFTCVCSRITNLSTTDTQEVSYTDCDNEEQVITLAPGITSDKVCIKKWNVETTEPPILYAEYFGNCEQGVCPHPNFPNARTVRPGYDTPICTPEKYDKITCNFADVMYKDALEKRYGISNCCPEDDQKWIVKKLLIDMQALKDLSYPCPTSCSTGTCNSSCNCKN